MCPQGGRNRHVKGFIWGSSYYHADLIPYGKEALCVSVPKTVVESQCLHSVTERKETLPAPVSAVVHAKDPGPVSAESQGDMLPITVMCTHLHPHATRM